MSSKNYLQSGLTNIEVAKSLAQFGPNEIITKKSFTALKIILAQFRSFLIIILLLSGGVSIYLGEKIDGFAIFAIVIINAIIGFIQEYKAENAVNKLKDLIIPTVVVIRENEKQVIAVKNLVPGDIVLLSEGEKIPADLELIEAFSLTVDESILTGESNPSNKKAGAKDKSGQLFKGTLITTGRAKAKVMATGMSTQFGKIINLLNREEKTRSPLSIQLDKLGQKIGLFVLVLAATIFVLGILRNFSSLDMLMTSVALGVSAIPEGMPVIVTLTLALGVQALARKQAIVRKMNSIETLGATTVICSDKTGTLTLNEMTVKKVFTNFKEEEIAGLGYTFDEKTKLQTTEQKKLLEICENCNNSFVEKNIIGDPTEIALKILTRKADFVKIYDKLDENIFTSERKIMSTLHKIEGKKEILVKGALEQVIKKCSHILLNGKVQKITPAEKKKILDQNEKYSNQALRVLAFAYKEYDNKFDEENLTFVGLVAMLDPPRETVKESIKTALAAGIRVKIITGDSPITAKAIGELIGLKSGTPVTGDEIDKLNDKELIKLLAKTSIFARTNPEHKYRLVDLLKRSGEVVAVTGDGVNDAPALKHADVGIAMGIKGTEATKEVADIVLKDDNFSTIVNTVKEGRKIYNNILAFIKYMLAANFSSLFIVGIIATAGFPLPILPLQILWINIATDALPALALGQSPAAKNIMQQKPRPKEENIFRKFMIFIFVAILFQIIINICLYFYGLSKDQSLGINLANMDIASYTRTLIFTETVIFEILFAFVCQQEKVMGIKALFANKSLIMANIISFLLQLMVVYTPFFQNIFKTVPLSLTDLVLVFACCLTVFLVPATSELIRKIFRK
ncbi:MAG: HAD-IC family P-type ATPase [Patescibacteria group bacterium]